MNNEQRDPHLDPLQWHHGYVGVGLMLGSLLITLLLPTNTVSVNRLVIISVITGTGLWLFIDDLCQHLTQHYHPGYRSPVNKLWGKVLRLCRKVKLRWEFTKYK